MLTIELLEADDMPAVVIVTWPLKPTVLHPRRFPDAAATAVKLFAEAATTLAGKATSTTPEGRGPQHGPPLPFLEMLSVLSGVAFAERVAIDSALGVRRVRRAIAKAFEVQRSGAGLSIVEVLSPCPTHWRMDSVQAWEYITQSVRTAYPTGVLVDRTRAAATPMDQGLDE